MIPLKTLCLTFGPSIYAYLPFRLAILPLLKHLGTSGLTLGVLLLSAVLLLNSHLLHLLPARFAFRSLLPAVSLLLPAVLLGTHGLTLLGLLSCLLAAVVHLVHPLLSASFVLLTHLLHHLLSLLAAVGTCLLLTHLAAASVAAPILTLRRAGLSHLASSATASVAALLTLNLSLRSAAVAAATTLGRRTASVAPAISAAAPAALALAKRIGLCADHDRQCRKSGENEFI